VVAVWGLNFVLIKVALYDLPPFTLAAVRFFFTAFPAVFFIPRPKVPWLSLAGYGLSTFTLQFAFLFTAMRLGMSAGLSSMVLQVQVFFTMGLAVFFFKERPSLLKIIGAVISFVGVALVGLHSNQDVNLLGLLMLLCAALSWATGNIVSKSLGNINPLALVVWGGLIACPVLAILAGVVEGPQVFAHSIANISLPGIGAVTYIVYLSTHFGYSLWSWLIREYHASTIAPFTLLVPVFGFISSAILLGEEITDWKIHAGILVITGLLVNLYSTRKMRITKPS
jgi:O-acetylserine/cysteine efflux transporter